MSDIQNRALGPNGIIVNYSHHTKPVHKLEYIWKIDNYSFYHEKKQILETPVFAVDTNRNFRWRLTHRPSSAVEDEDFMGVYLRLDISSECKKAFVKYRLSILDDKLEENIIIALKKGRTFNADDHGGSDGWGCRKAISKHQLSNKKLLPDDRLTIYCEATFSESEDLMKISEEPNPHSIQVQPACIQHCISEDFENLFKNQELTDVVLSVNGKEYRAHKVILTARSPVFAAMFKYKTKENENNLVEIIDIEEKVFEEMLLYIYTDKCKNLKDVAPGLLAASNKYDLKRLKIMCQGFLINNLTVDNAPETLGFADLHCAPELKSKTIDFIVANSAKVIDSANWNRFAPTYPQLVMEVCAAFSRQAAALFTD